MQELRGGMAAPIGPHRRKQVRGASFGSCLVMIIVFFGGLVWAYFHFLENRYLEKPGQALTIVKDYKKDMYNNYRNRMRTETKGRIGMLNKEVKDFIVETKKGKYKSDYAGFKQRYHETTAELRAVAGDVNVRSVPQPFEKPHRDYCQVLTHFYNALNLMYESESAEEPTIKESKFKEAAKEYQTADKLFEVTWPAFNRTPGT